MGRLCGIILSLFFATMCVGVSYGLTFVPWFERLTAPMQLATVAATMAVIGLIALVPAGALYDRTLRRLSRFVEATADGGPRDDLVHPPRPFAAVAKPFEEWTQVIHERQSLLSEQLRDVQVRFQIQQTECNQLKDVLHAMRDAVIVTNAFDEVVTLNHSAAEIVQIDEAGELRRPMDQIISDARLRDFIREVRESGNIHESRQIEHEIKRGNESTGYQVMLSTLANNKGEVGAVVTILHDLTREREIAQMKSDFVSKASHELRTPLSSIRGYVEMLVDGEADDEASRREFYTIIQNETSRLSRMIDNMLNISRIEAGIIQVDRERVDFAQLIRRAAEALGPQASEKDITVTAKASPVDLTAEGDKDMLYQVVLNLISNSVKYTPDGGRVTVAADSDNLTRSIVVTVSDTGLGIPPDALPRLFEKFYRIENFKRVAKGTGLGLNLCKHIVETVHCGQIGVESQLGMGSKFWFSIPMRFAGAAAA